MQYLKGEGESRMIRQLRVVPVLLFVLATIAPARAQTEAKVAARDHYQRGLELANRGEYGAALAEFDQAYAASPNYAVLYNIGQANVGLGRARPAIDALRRYLKEGDGEIPPARRAEVEQQVALLESSFVSLTITTAPTGATVSVDGTAVGTTPLASPVRVTAGTHVVSATRPGAPPAWRVVKLAEGAPASVAIELPEPPAPTSPSAAAPAPSPPPARTCAERAPAASPFPTGFVLVGAGVAVGGVALGHYLWNHGRLEDFRANEAALQTDTSPGRNERLLANNALGDSIDRASVVTVVLGVSAGALLASGAAWLLVEPRHRRERAAWAAPPFDVRVSASSADVTWRGAW